ncbi:MAG: glycosyltransferase [Sphaerochaeta sp.]|nr:glycosyltransferase [Sphaerochaeta sp.]
METQVVSEKKIRLMYVVESFSTGVYAIVRDVACNLDPQRFEVLILHSLRSDSPKNYSQDFNSQNITMSHIPMGTSRDYLKAIASIRKAIHEFQPDSIHLHSSKAGFLGRIAAHNSKARLFYTPHGISFIRTDVGPVKRNIFYLLEKFIQLYTPSRMIAVSPAEYENVKKLTTDATVINNFIDVASVPQSQAPDSLLVGITGRITEAKNPPLFNRIALGMPSVQFIWIGDGDLRAQLSALNIQITGQVTRSEALQKLSELSVYIQTSSWEGMPISLLEAMACSKPVVVSKIPAHENLIQDGTSGYICASNDENQFIEKIRLLLDQPDLRSALGQGAKTFVLAYHDLKQAIERYSTEYAGTPTAY